MHHSDPADSKMARTTYGSNFLHWSQPVRDIEVELCMDMAFWMMCMVCIDVFFFVYLNVTCSQISVILLGFPAAE